MGGSSVPEGQIILESEVHATRKYTDWFLLPDIYLIKEML